jgi:DNA-binding response OmpR family regulator
MTKILIVEDDPQIMQSIRMNLRLSGYATSCVSTIKAAWDEIIENKFDLICLDIGLPDGCGLELCKKIREDGHEIPILFISALVDEATVVKGLSRGGDDYLRKPFGMEELKVRMNRLIKRAGLPYPDIKVGNLIIDQSSKVASIMGEVINLGRKEMEILILLSKKAGQIVSRESILNTVYQDSELYDRTVDSHMSHLRKKIKEVAGDAIQINSVYGQGYRLQWR